MTLTNAVEQDYRSVINFEVRSMLKVKDVVKCIKKTKIQIAKRHEGDIKKK